MPTFLAGHASHSASDGRQAALPPFYRRQAAAAFLRDAARRRGQRPPSISESESRVTHARRQFLISPRAVDSVLNDFFSAISLLPGVSLGPVSRCRVTRAEC